jgi:hypothetical protein
MRLVIVLIALLGIAALSAGSDYYPYSLEFLTDSSDLVVRGKVSSYSLVDHGWSVVHLDVEEALKGRLPNLDAQEVPGKLTVVLTAVVRSEDLSQAQKDQRSILWFLPLVPQGAKPGESSYQLRDPENRTRGLRFAQYGRRLIDFNLRPVYLEETIFEEVRKEAILKPSRNDSAITLPAPAWFGSSSSAAVGAGKSAPTITFPMDERILPLAKKWVQPRSGEPWQRLFGVQVLANFKSDENVALLKALVNDPGGIGADSFGGRSDFKAEAAKVLEHWGIPVPPPPMADLIYPSAVSSRPVRVEIDGVEVSFEGASPPRIIGDRAYARACTISRPLHVMMLTVSFKETTGVSLSKKDLDIYMPTDSHLVWVNDKVEEVPWPARRLKDEGFFPIRYIAEKLGATVKWDAKRHMVLIRMGS